jgi:hypothetical protein
MVCGEPLTADEAAVGAWRGLLAALVDATRAQTAGVVGGAPAAGGEQGSSEQLGEACEAAAREVSMPSGHAATIADRAACGRFAAAPALDDWVETRRLPSAVAAGVVVEPTLHLGGAHLLFQSRNRPGIAEWIHHPALPCSKVRRDGMKTLGDERYAHCGACPSSAMAAQAGGLLPALNRRARETD